MKVTVLFDNLQNGLSFVSHGVSNRNPMPSLLNFLLEVKNGKLTVSATDLEIGITSTIPCKSEKDGSVCVGAKTFLDFISNINTDKISLETNGTSLVLLGKGIKASFPTSSVEEFPKLYEDRGKKLATIKKEELDRELTRIVFAASLDLGRPALSGVLIRKEDASNTLILVATDGYRLSLKKNLKIKLEDKTDVSLLIPARLLRELFSFKTQEDSIDVYVSRESNQIIFADSQTTLVGRLIEAEYPDYEKILPTDFSVTAQFDKTEAQNAIRACMVFAREAANIVKVSIEKDTVVFSSSAPQSGENSIEISSKVTGEENQIAFNAKYLMDFFSNIDDDTVSFEMSGPLNPGVFKTLKDPDFLHLIMPIRVTE
jgi:DNA polymerase-3 subunit beta